MSFLRYGNCTMPLIAFQKNNNIITNINNFKVSCSMCEKLISRELLKGKQLIFIFKKADIKRSEAEKR